MRVPNPRLARRRALEAIRRECEHKKAELRAGPALTAFRNPTFYFGVIVLLTLIGASLFSASDRAVVRRAEAPQSRALRHLDALAEALGRYRFHVGAYPTEAQGLAALVRDPQVPKWDGPYVSLLRSDPWGTPYAYKPAETGYPTLYSCGPDRLAGTADDLHPVASRFEPGTAWTNGWVSAELRLPGVRVLRSLSEVGGGQGRAP